MNDPGAQRPGEPVPLDQRYTGADPIEWCGAAVYPMYTEALPAGTTAVRLRALSVMAPAEVTGLGLGLSVHDGHVNLDGKSLGGVDIWYEALATGIDISVTADAPDALFTLTPVWVAGSGGHQSWTGNYGMVVDLLPGGASTLWCSTGPGTPDFNELVVELSTGPAELAHPSISRPAQTERAPRGYSAPAIRPDSTGESTPDTVPDPAPTALAVDPPTEPTIAPPAPRPANQGVGGALHDLGTAMHQRGEHDSARVLWTQAAQAGHSGAAYDLGALLLQQGERAAAEQWWKAAARDDPRAAASLTALSELP